MSTSKRQQGKEKYFTKIKKFFVLNDEKSESDCLRNGKMLQSKHKGRISCKKDQNGSESITTKYTYDDREIRSQKSMQMGRKRPMNITAGILL